MDDLTPGQRWRRGAWTAAALGPIAGGAEACLCLITTGMDLSIPERLAVVVAAVATHTALAVALAFAFGFVHPRFFARDPVSGLATQLGLTAAAICALHTLPLASRHDALGEAGVAGTLIAQVPLVGLLSFYAIRVLHHVAGAAFAPALLGLGLTLCAAGAAAPAPPSTSKPVGAHPGLVLITLDALPAAALDDGSSPHLAAFAASARVYRNAVAPTSSAVANAASLLTGMHPLRHGVIDDAGALRPGTPTFARWIAAEQAAPDALISDLRLGAHTGLDAGFTTWRTGSTGAPARGVDATHLTRRAWSARLAGPVRTPGADLLAHALPRVGALDGRVLWVHFGGARAPWAGVDLPDHGVDEATRAEADRAARGARTAVDADLGALLDAIPPDASVVLAGLRGAVTGQHGHGPEAAALWDESVRVPIVIRAPGATPGVLDDQASLLDLAPTIAHLVGLSAPRVEGVNLLPPLDAAPELPSWHLLYGQEPDGTPLIGLRTDDLKAMFDVRSKDIAVYDLANDPGERADISSSQPEIAATIAGLLARERVASESFVPVRALPSDLAARFAEER
jgi:hypothetical protein